jgi:two-component system, response regulator YesN
MRKILIVDDEKLIRLGVKAMIEKKQKDFYDITLCSNGKEALELVQREKFDIVLTDIRMPQMDGITFIQNLQSVEFKPAILILSGYDDFNYALEALKCGAKDYLLKPIKREELYSSIDKVEKELEASKEIASKEVLVSSYIEDFRANELNYIFLRTNISEEEIEESGKRLELDIFNDKYYLGLALGSETGSSMNNDFRNDIHLTIEDFMRSRKNKNIYIFDNDCGVVIIANDLSVFEYLEGRYSKESFFKLFIGISEELSGIKEVKKAYCQAREALKYRTFSYYYGTTLISYSSISKKSTDFVMPTEKVEILRNLIETDREKEIEKILFELLNEGKARDFSILYVEELNKQINQIVLQEIKSKFFLKEEEVLERFQKFKEIYCFNNFKEYSHDLKEFILYLNEYIRTMKDLYGDKKNIDKAIDYINENYYKDLNLAIVSNEVSLNYSYFSQVFKEYTGENFVNYLKKIRINKAKVLLRDSDYKIYEVAQKVGYEDSKQFAKIFRSVTGVSPIEYRDSVSKRKEPVS